MRLWVRLYGQAKCEDIAVGEVGARNGSAISRATGYGITNVPYFSIQKFVDPESGNAQGRMVEEGRLRHTLCDAEVSFVEYEPRQLAVFGLRAGLLRFSL